MWETVAAAAGGMSVDAPFEDVMMRHTRSLLMDLGYRRQCEIGYNPAIRWKGKGDVVLHARRRGRRIVASDHDHQTMCGLCHVFTG